jgi:hypothetical protein
MYRHRLQRAITLLCSPPPPHVTRGVPAFFFTATLRRLSSFVLPNKNPDSSQQLTRFTRPYAWRYALG